MKKIVYTIVLVLAGLTIASAHVPVNKQDTVKVKTKMAHHHLKKKIKGPAGKIKTKAKDTVKKS